MKWNFVARREGEELPVVVAALEIVVVDRHDEVAFLDLQVVAIGGPSL
jgi:hypothetical protein